MCTTPLRTIAHIDLDSFYVSVERARNKQLRGKPVAVGGQSERGVISSCSYEARKFGVRSAMPVKRAKQLCPELLIVKGDMAAYAAVSREITDIIAAQVPLYEKSSIDEFYIDLTGMDRFFGASRCMAELRQTIMTRMKLPVSYGLASNKLISKVATNEAKPNGFLEIPPGKEQSFLAPMPVEKLPMVGQKTRQLLNDMGIRTLGQLSAMPANTLIARLGKSGMELWRRANGMDDTPVIPSHEQKSIGTESTFHTDTGDQSFLTRELIRMTEQIAFELRDHHKLTGCITVKIRYTDFQTHTRQSVIPHTAVDPILQKKAIELFSGLYDPRRKLRLIGLRLSHLVPGNYQIDLFNDTHRSIQLYQAIDHIKHRFGETKLLRAAGTLFHSPKMHPGHLATQVSSINPVSDFGTERLKNSTAPAIPAARTTPPVPNRKH